MAMIEQAPRQVAVKVSPEGDRLITSGAHYLHMTKKELVEAAVAFYLDARREEMQAGMRELLGTLDGSRAARIAMLAGMTREELDSVGGVEEDARRSRGLAGPRCAVCVRTSRWLSRAPTPRWREISHPLLARATERFADDRTPPDRAGCGFEPPAPPRAYH